MTWSNDTAPLNMPYDGVFGINFLILSGMLLQTSHTNLQMLCTYDFMVSSFVIEWSL